MPRHRNFRRPLVDMRISSSVFSRKIHRNVLAKTGFHKTLLPKKLCMYVCVCCCESCMLDSQQQKQKFTTFLSFSYLFPIDGILSTPPNTLVIHLLDWGCGWREEEERWYCKQRKKERKFHDLLLLLNSKSPNKKFRFSLKLQVPFNFMGVQKQEEKEKYKTPYHTKQPSFYPTHKNKIAVRDSSWPHHTLKEIISSSTMNSMSKDLRD